MKESDKKVSFDNEKLLVVDKNNNIIGYDSKANIHAGEGILHRAFSIFIFNDQGEMLLQKRSKKKLLWPLFWSNSVCSHPRENESNEIATQRRLKEELGIVTPIKYLFSFQYQANFNDIGSEREYCSVYIGKSNGPFFINNNEIDEWKFIPLEELNCELNKSPKKYTPWFKIEWDKILKNHLESIHSILPDTLTSKKK